MSRQFWGLSLRSWLTLTVLTAVLLTLVGLGSFGGRPDHSGSAGAEPGLPSATPHPDRKLAGGVTARLMQCGKQGDARPAVRGAGERAKDPGLTVLGWETNGPGPKATLPPGDQGFSLTVYAAVSAGQRTLRLAAPLFAGRGTVDVVSPWGAGRSASASGLDVTVVEEGPERKPVGAPASGVHHVAPGERLLLKVEVPSGAICPGLDPLDVIACSPEEGDAPADACPTLTLTLTDPAVRAYRAQGAAQPPERFSDRLVGVLSNPADTVTQV
ncbi:hypothetical protein [Streptomyces sp. NPDC051561]|uniref:hypothetical protein n=1 Tax=Streptomyces sp. NPDC051561 TaxID=3365658 RepID=UPI0037AEF306